MSRPWLSVVTITRDDPEGLARTLASTFALRRQGAEHIVVDGSSAAALAGNLVGDGNLGVQLISSPPRGIADAFNVGLEKTQGEWVWFLNGGDAAHERLDPDWLCVLLKTTRAQVVAGAIHMDGEDGPRPQPHLSYQWPLLACWLMHPATLVRRERLLAIGGFDPKWRVAMDYHLWFRLLDKTTTVDVISVPLARFDPNGLSEHPASAALATCEEAGVVLQQAGPIALSGLWLCLRIVRRIVWAVLFRLYPAGRHKTSRR